MTDHGAAGLVARTREDLAAAATGNRFVEMLETGRLPRERLAWLAGEEHRIVSSDRRSFALLAARYPDSSSGELFLGLAQGEGRALELLGEFAGVLGQSEKNLMAYEPKPLAQGIPGLPRAAGRVRDGQ